MSERIITFGEATREAMLEEMRADERVFVYGEDIAKQGGIFGQFAGMKDEFPERVLDTPISETALVGAGVGAAIAGAKPVIDLHFADFIGIAMDEVLNQMAKAHYMFGGQATMSLVLRAPDGLMKHGAAQHSQSLETWFTNIPGIRVVVPSTPVNGKQLLKAAIKDPFPVKGDVPEDLPPIDLSRAEVVREGTDVTLVSYGLMLTKALAAADVARREYGVSVEVIDLRSITPLDMPTIYASVKKTGHLVIAHEAIKIGGVGGEIAARVAENHFDYLRGPVLRVGARFTPLPFSPVMEDFVLSVAAGAPLISLDHVTVEFGRGKNRFRAVDDVSLTINKGSIYGIIGFSGAGKSTLVRTMNVLQRPTSGTVTFNGTTISTLGEGRLLPLRRKIAMIFQHFNLMPSRTVLDNVTLPLIHEKVSRKDARAKAMHLLELVGIADKAKAYPRQLSGGQQQRVAIARALIGDPEVLLCDKATSALDPRTTRSILALLKDLNARLGLTIVLITHQMQVVKDICTDLAVMSHGKVVDDGSILDVFDHPSNELTREFIYTSGNMNKGITLVQEHPLFSKERESGSVYLLFSVGSGAEETLMADIRERFGVRGNIMFGNVDVIHGTPVGMILVSLDGPAEAVSKALAYFPTVGVSATPLADLHVNEVEENDNE